MISKLTAQEMAEDSKLGYPNFLNYLKSTGKSEEEVKEIMHSNKFLNYLKSTGISEAEKNQLLDEIDELKADLASADREIELLNNRIARIRHKTGLSQSTSPTPTTPPKAEKIDYGKVLMSMRQNGADDEKLRKQKQIWIDNKCM